jgi:hypothetical protein
VKEGARDEGGRQWSAGKAEAASHCEHQSSIEKRQCISHKTEQACTSRCRIEMLEKQGPNSTVGRAAVAWPSTVLGVRTAPPVLCIVVLSRSVSVQWAPLCCMFVRSSRRAVCKVTEATSTYLSKGSILCTCGVLPVRWLRASACVRVAGAVGRGGSEFVDFRRRVALRLHLLTRSDAHTGTGVHTNTNTRKRTERRGHLL